jgi:pimeloyl-ACP methyl ester carboxylesterase
LKIVRNTIQLACDTYGDERDPMLLLVSGAGAPAEFWPMEFCRNLASLGLFVVRYSHRDTGYSTHCDEKYEIEELLMDMVGLVGGFGNRTVHLVGHSMGGYLVQMALCRFPQIFSSGVSISAGSTVAPETMSELGMSSVAEETWGILMANRPAGDFEADLSGWLASWRFLNGNRPFDEALATCYTRALYVGDERNARVATNHIHAMSTVPGSLVADLSGIRCPFLVIHGTNDPLVPLDNGEATARLVSASRITRLEGAGHMFFARHTWREISDALALHVDGCA